MQNRILIIAAIVLSGCAKTYKCECKTLDHNSGNVTTSSYGINDKKDAATAKCNGGDEYSNSYSRDCAING